jgi:putative membrane protein
LTTGKVLLIRVPESVIIFLKGLLMGMADIVPGVSGGTMALITGIYERFVSALSSISPRFIIRLAKGDMKGAKESWWSIDWAMLIPLFTGILSAMVIFALIIDHLLDNYAGPTYAFFFGLILASAGFVYRYVEHVDTKNVLSGVMAFLLVVVVVGMEEITSNHSLPILFVSGAIAVCAMILPGISGSLTLLILGQYEYFLETLNKFSWKELIVFGAGAVVGILAFARLLNWLLKNHRSVTMAFLFGCMLGALRLPGEEIIDHTDFAIAYEVIIVVITAMMGFIGVFILQKQSDRIKDRLGLENVD